MLSPPPPPMLVNELVIFGQTLQFPPDLVIIGQKKKTFRLNSKKEKIGTICLIVLFCLNWSYFVSFGQICLFQSYLLIFCAIYGTFLVGQSSFLNGQSSTKSVKLVKIVNAP